MIRLPKRDRKSRYVTLDPERLRWVFDLVNWGQAAWMVGVGVLLVLAPSSRFATPSWQFIEYVDGGDNYAGVIYVIIGLMLLLSLATSRQGLMSYSLLVGGLFNWAMALFLISGALHGSTGALGGPFCLYVGAHMLLTSVMLTKRKG